MNICAQDGLIIIIVYFCLHVCMVMCVNMYYIIICIICIKNAVRYLQKE